MVKHKLLTNPTLFAFGSEVKTPFGLLGKDENALTFAFGFTMQQCPVLLQRFLSSIGIRGMRINTLQKAEILLQEKDRNGITDLEIKVPNELYIIVEAKVRLRVPTINQCRRYIQKLKAANERAKRLVIILDCDPGPIISEYCSKNSDCASFLTGIHWSDLNRYQINSTKAIDANEQLRWLQHFFRFMNEEYHMKSFTDEVWIPPASTRPLWKDGKSLYDTHIQGRIYYHNRFTNRKPLYIAFHAGGEVKYIQRVLRIEHNAKPVDYYKQLENVKKGAWPRKPHTIWHLSEPAKLPKPLKSGPIWRRHITCDFDLLLTCNTVKQIEERMKERRSTQQL
jgi:hypothetical protein